LVDAALSANGHAILDEFYERLINVCSEVGKAFVNVKSEENLANADGDFVSPG